LRAWLRRTAASREGGNTGLFTRKYNAVVKLWGLLPEGEREAVLVPLRGALERVAEGVRPALKRWAEGGGEP